MDVEQLADPPNSSQAQDVAERGTSADPEPRVFNICGLCKFRFHEGQAIVTGMSKIWSSHPQVCLQITL